MSDSKSELFEIHPPSVPSRKANPAIESVLLHGEALADSAH